MSRAKAKQPKRRAKTETTKTTALVAPLSDADRLLVAQHKERLAARTVRPPAFKDVIQDGTTTVVAHPDLERVDLDLWKAQLAAATGADLMETGAPRSDELARIVQNGGRSVASRLSAALGTMLEIGPRDGVESMLAAQMVGVHSVAMGLLTATSNGRFNIEAANFELSAASRLLALFTRQMEALQAYRGRGRSEQTVRVEHVHVHSGGQAVVGNVTPPGEQGEQGGGDGHASS